MAVSPFDSAIHGAYLSDAETAAPFGDAEEVRAMLAVEAALARVQGALDVIPKAAAKRIAQVAGTTEIAPEMLAAGSARDGMPIPALVAALREAVGAEAGQYVHWGATSQDIVDTALVLRLRRALDVIAPRLDHIIAALAVQAEAHRGTVMAARTRTQPATPTTFGLTIAGWLAPLIRHRDRLAETRPRVLVLQFGGATGTLAALGDDGLEVAEALARDLDLMLPPMPFHTQRDGPAELAGWLSLVSASLAKMAADLIWLGQAELGEVRAGAGGGSSTLPQKNNPIEAEAIVALARFNAGLLATMHQAVVAPLERDGVGWNLEWLSLPQMVVATGAALRHGLALAESLQAVPERMRANIEATNGLILAEAASFALAAHMPLDEARTLVKSACAEVVTSGRHLMDILADDAKAPIDWQAFKDPARHLGRADDFIDRVLARAKP